MVSTKTGAIWAGISAGMMVIGAIGPWATAFGVFSVAGTDGDGVIVLFAGLIVGAMVLLWYLRRGGHWTLIVAVLAAVAAAATSIYDMANIQSSISNSHGLVSIGWGLWLDCIASVIAIVALVATLRAALTDDGVPVPPQARSLPEATESAARDSQHQTVAADRPAAAVARMDEAEAALKVGDFRKALTTAWDEVEEASRRRDSEQLEAIRALAYKMEQASSAEYMRRAAATLAEGAESAAANIQAHHDELAEAESNTEDSVSEAEAAPTLGSASSSLQVMDEPQRLFCDRCGQRLGSTARFCRACGHPVPGRSDAH